MEFINPEIKSERENDESQIVTILWKVKKIEGKMRITAVSYPPLLAFLFIVPALSQGEAYPTQSS